MPTRSYDQLKEFGGKRYTGMAVGRSHKWKYDAGEWKERKVTPDRWEFTYAVVKRRAGRAPEGSGAPLGTAYHWYIVADQIVTKLDANSYMTEMVGHKLKVTHRRADKNSWAASERAKRKQLVKLLRELADDLERRPLDDKLESTDGVSATPTAADSRAGAAKQVKRAHAARTGHAKRSRPDHTARAAHAKRTTSKQRAAHRSRGVRSRPPVRGASGERARARRR